MYEPLGRATLKADEGVEMGVVKGPEPDWAGRMEELLAHKGAFWQWGNEQVLRHDRGIDAFYYILHRDGEPFANIMTIEHRGVGILGHVFTKPEDRRKGAASALMKRLMAHFTDRGGQALYLGTGYDSPAYHIYRAHGFRSVEPESGCMAAYADAADGFHDAFFAPGAAEVKPLGWSHWPASPPLFVGDWPGAVRCVPFRILGRQSTEGPALQRLKADADSRDAGREAVTAAVLEHTETSAVVGLAAFGPDPLWPRTVLVDVYCHPAFWDRAGALLGALELPSAERYMAYSDSACPRKAEALSAAGFRPVTDLPKHVAADRLRARMLDVTAWHRS